MVLENRAGGAGQAGGHLSARDGLGRLNFSGVSARQSRGRVEPGFNEAENSCCPQHQRGSHFQGMAKISFPNEHGNT